MHEASCMNTNQHKHNERGNMEAEPLFTIDMGLYNPDELVLKALDMLLETTSSDVQQYLNDAWHQLMNDPRVILLDDQQMLMIFDTEEDRTEYENSWGEGS